MTDQHDGKTSANSDENSPPRQTLEVDSPSPEEVGEKLFRWRDYTPIPLIIIVIWLSDPNAVSATLGIVSIALGEALRIYSVAFIGSISRTRKDNTGDQLITGGPFQYVRNPLYVGNFLISFGMAIYSSSLLAMILTAVAFGVQYYFIVKYEESLLRGKFGEAYTRYCETVPPWIPSRLPQIDELEIPDSIGPALKSEKRTLSAIGVMLIALLITAISRS